MTKVFMVRTMSGLMPDPTDDRAAVALNGIKMGQSVMVDVTRPRNLQMHKLYWVLCTKLASAIDAEPENISDVLKLRTGHHVTVQTASGPVQLPRSISFAAMDQAEFRSFFDRACREVCVAWLPHMTAKQVQTEVLELMGITWEQAA